MRFLIDECLSIDLVPIANQAEHEAQQRLFLGALEEPPRFAEPVNRVLEVDIEGDQVTLKLHALRAGSF
jgi:hypothetical protein